MATGSPFLKWLEGVLQNISELLFADPSTFLVFLQIGTVLTVFSLSQVLSAQTPSTARPRSLQQRALLQARREFYKLLRVISACGTFYFTATPLALLLTTFERPSPPVVPGKLFIVISNATFILILVPTLYISIYYIYYRIRRFRLH